MDARTTEDGVTVRVAEGETLHGSKGPFCVVYRSESREERYGYMCANCESLNNAMDTMGRIVCNECGNTKKPDEWDAAHE